MARTFEIDPSLYPVQQLPPQTANLAGKLYGHLRVLWFAGRTETGHHRWVCRCELCGNHVAPLAQNLKKGASTSCGCAPHKKAVKTKLNRRENKLLDGLLEIRRRIEAGEKVVVTE